MPRHPLLLTSLFALTFTTLAAVGCGDDDPAIVACPEGTAVGVELNCSCDDAGSGVQVCEEGNKLSACVCDPGGGAGSSAGSGTAGTTAGTGAAGTGAAGSAGSGDEDDAGVTDVVDGSVADGGNTTPPKPNQPVMDGTMLASCTSDADCNGGLRCYDAGGATLVGYCTSTCNGDGDCTSLGDNYACSSAGLGTRYCRSECDGPKDKSCPEHMSCQVVPPGSTYRCLYDAKDIGTGKGKVFDKCNGSGDCEGDLLCYANGVSLNNIGGMSYLGFCTEGCKTDNDCAANPATGEVAPKCMFDKTCGLSCDSLLGLGAPECPKDMQCIPVGLLTDQCLYVDTATGGI